MYTSLLCNENFDIELDDKGFLKTLDDGSSIANMLKLDFMSNSNWELDPSLGVDWMNKDNNGFLQSKNSEVLIVNEIQRKLENIDGVREVSEITINKTASRKLIIDVTIIAYDGTEYLLSTEGGI